MNIFERLFGIKEKKKVKPNFALCYCVPQSVCCGWSWAAMKKLPVRIAITKISVKPNRDHSQAETFKDGKWQPLIMEWSDKGPIVKIGHRHFDIYPYRHISLRQWVSEQIQYTDQK